jgi:hypothetical protein
MPCPGLRPQSCSLKRSANGRCTRVKSRQPGTHARAPAAQRAVEAVQRSSSAGERSVGIHMRALSLYHGRSRRIHWAWRLTIPKHWQYFLRDIRQLLANYHTIAR